MPNMAVVGDGGGWSGVEGWSQLVGVNDTTCADRSDGKFNSCGREFPENGTDLVATAGNKHISQLQK